MIRIFDINTYRDGGSFEFYVESPHHEPYQVWLAARHSGELRRLYIGNRIATGATAIAVISEIEEWLNSPESKTVSDYDLASIQLFKEYVTKNYFKGGLLS